MTDVNYFFSEIKYNLLQELVEYEGREDAIRFKQLLDYAVIEEIITLSRVSELANISLSNFKENVQAAV